MAVAAQLHEGKMAFEANKEEGKDIFRKRVEVCHVEGCVSCRRVCSYYLM